MSNSNPHQISDSEDDEELPTAKKVQKETRRENYVSSGTKRKSEQSAAGQMETKKPRTDESQRVRTLRRAAPVNFFLTCVNDLAETHREDLSLYLWDILSIDHGKLVKSMQTCMLLSVPFVMDCYHRARNKDHEILLLCQSGAGNDVDGAPSNVTVVQVKPQEPWGTHHSKMMMLLYEDGMRVVVHTANLIIQDWYNKTQGLWVGPKVPRLKPGSDSKMGESPTNFKRDLRRYFASYKEKEIAQWLKIIDEHDFSSVNVFFIPHVPGRHVGPQKDMWGLRYVNSILRKERERFGTWPVCAQISSIGSLGKSPKEWLEGEFSNCLKGFDTNLDRIKVVYPTVEDVRTSLEGYLAGGSLPYQSSTHIRQQWLDSYFHSWNSRKRSRTCASPHIKTYCRMSPDGQKCAWFILSSANLSKAAWGVSQKNETQFYIRSHEAGILFLPKYIIGQKEFEVLEDGNVRGEECRKFPVPWDYPPTPYKHGDQVWRVDGRYNVPDADGTRWPLS